LLSRKGENMLRIGTIQDLWRYPVKGMAGERLASCALGPHGLRGDRIWALRDVQRKEIQSCKFRPHLLQCSARLREEATHGQDALEVTFPDGAVLDGNDAQIHARLSQLTGHASTLEALRSASEVDFFRRHKLDDHTWLEELVSTFDREPGEPLPDFSQLPPEVIDYVAMPGTFFLVTPLHLVTTATLRWLQSRNAQAEWDARRFRPNFVIDTQSTGAGIVEQDWVGRRLRIADAVIDCVAGTPRCGAVTRAQPELAEDKSILRTIVKDASQNLGVYATIAQAGSISVGDAVFLE
jgi:uncharacterized protein